MDPVTLAEVTDMFVAPGGAGRADAVAYSDFMARLACLLGAGSRGRHAAVVALDISRFSDINALIGYAAGDRVLQAVTDRLERAAGTGVVMARENANKFLFLVQGRSHEATGRLVARLQAAFAAPFACDAHPVQLAACLGVIDITESRCAVEYAMLTLEGVLARARLAGPGACRSARPDGEGGGGGEPYRVRLGAALRRALDTDALSVHYQPQIALDSGAVVGVEALVRWHEPSLGHVAADAIVGVAEEVGLIDRLGKWVMRAACRQMQEWRGAGLGHLRIAVNVSAQQFAQPGLCEEVLAILDETGLPPANLEIELTESLPLADMARCVSRLEELRHHGIRVALDDFGTGYSSLSYLSRLPIDTVKIDRSFLDGVPGCRRGASLVRAVIGMAHGLGLQVVAEGVEQQEQIDFLVAAGCDVAQGYLFSRPMPASGIADYFRRAREGGGAGAPGVGGARPLPA